MPELNNFMINNFKIFEGKHWFDFKDLNVFTGPNNTGKSTFIQALKLFAEGFQNSDFPSLDLNTGTENLGGFNKVLNFKNSDDKFGFGFKVQIAELDKLFEVHYKFSEGFEEENKDMATFYSFEIKDDNETFFGIYDHYKINETSYESPHDDGDIMSMLIGKMNIKLLRRYMAHIANEEFTEILDYFNQTFHDYWWFEVFKEYDNDTRKGNTIIDKRLADLLNNLKKDDYLNLANFEMKEVIHFSDEKEIQKNEAEKYLRIRNSTDFPNFINKVVTKIIEPVINHIESYLFIFSNENMIQIKPTDLYQKRLIPFEKEKDILRRIERIQGHADFNTFIENSTNIFFKNGNKAQVEKYNLKVKRNLMFGYSVKLGYFLPISDIEKKNAKNSRSSLQKFTIRTMPDKHTNIAELGKGSNNLLMLILKIASIVHDKNGKTKASKLVLVEEPETFLHPAWQSKLADLFAFCMNEYNVQFFIETHSEYLIRKLQYLTAKKEIKPEDSVIYYFHHPDKVPEGEEQVKKLEILDDGSLTGDFGPGFFDEADNIAMELYRLQRNKTQMN